MATEEQVKEAFSEAMHPEIDANFIELHMIGDINIEDGGVEITINLPFPGVPIQDDLGRIAREAVTNELDVSEVAIEFGMMTDEEREDFRKQAREKWKL
ncbi:MAG: DUF59 domain-containing protein [Planctomycetes bacterium]|nr:DUF59 domain-containing protein [Planctomycetota bacterium]